MMPISNDQARSAFRKALDDRTPIRQVAYEAWDYGQMNLIPQPELVSPHSHFVSELTDNTIVFRNGSTLDTTEGPSQFWAGEQGELIWAAWNYVSLIPTARIIFDLSVNGDHIFASI